MLRISNVYKRSYSRTRRQYLLTFQPIPPITPVLYSRWQSRLSPKFYGLLLRRLWRNMCYRCSESSSSQLTWWCRNIRQRWTSRSHQRLRCCCNMYRQSGSGLRESGLIDVQGRWVANDGNGEELHKLFAPCCRCTFVTLYGLCKVLYSALVILCFYTIQNAIHHSCTKYHRNLSGWISDVRFQGIRLRVVLTPSVLWIQLQVRWHMHECIAYYMRTKIANMRKGTKDR